MLVGGYPVIAFDLGELVGDDVTGFGFAFFGAANLACLGIDLGLGGGLVGEGLNVLACPGVKVCHLEELDGEVAGLDAVGGDFEFVDLDIKDISKGESVALAEGLNAGLGCLALAVWRLWMGDGGLKGAELAGDGIVVGHGEGSA